MAILTVSLLTLVCRRYKLSGEQADLRRKKVLNYSSSERHTLCVLSTVSEIIGCIADARYYSNAKHQHTQLMAEHTYNITTDISIQSVLTMLSVHRVCVLWNSSYLYMHSHSYVYNELTPYSYINSINLYTLHFRCVS